MATFPHHHHHLQQQRQQHQQQQQQQSRSFRNFSGIDVDLSAPFALFNPPSMADQPHPSFVHVMGVAPAAAEAVPRAKRPREQEFLEGSQITSIDFLQSRSVSTGLGLSLDDGRGAVPSSSGESPLLLLPTVDDDIDRELQRMDAEMDRFVRIQSERLRQAILEKVQTKQLQILTTVEEKILRKVREKEVEVENINKKNLELEEQMKQLNDEIAAWQQRAKYNENMITALKYNLQQVLAYSGKDNREGFGDSEVDDAASCYNGGAMNFQLLSKENKDMKAHMICKFCKVNEACVLLLPCRHLCLCRECDSKFSCCPICQSSKFISMEIYL